MTRNAQIRLAAFICFFAAAMIAVAAWGHPRSVHRDHVAVRAELIWDEIAVLEDHWASFAANVEAGIVTPGTHPQQLAIFPAMLDGLKIRLGEIETLMDEPGCPALSEARTKLYQPTTGPVTVLQRAYDLAYGVRVFRTWEGADVQVIAFRVDAVTIKAVEIVWHLEDAMAEEGCN